MVQKLRAQRQSCRTVRRQHFIHVAPMVREIQHLTGLGQNKTAELIGVSWMTVSFWLRGKPARPPYAAMVEKTLKTLRKRRSEL